MPWLLRHNSNLKAEITPFLTFKAVPPSQYLPGMEPVTPAELYLSDWAGSGSTIRTGAGAVPSKSV